MSVNPALVPSVQGGLVPAPFQQEVFVLHRPGVLFEVDSVRTRNGKWSTRGTMFLSNIRLVFIADKPDESGLAAFDLPLVYIKGDALHQPIFGCNNLAGQVWPACEGGGPGGSLPPHAFTLYFKEGGIGTFYPMYYTLAERAKVAFQSSLAAQQQPRRQADPNPPEYASNLASRAFVDPNDPTTIYLSQPADENYRLPDRPVYAKNYGQDEVYEPMEPSILPAHQHPEPSAPPAPPGTRLVGAAGNAALAGFRAV